MSATETLRLARGELGRLTHAGLDSFSYRERAIRTLRALVPFDAVWWWTVDPASTFFTSGVFEPLPTDHTICGGVHANEYGDADFNKFRVLARRTGRAGVLSAATGGQLKRSDRYQHMLGSACRLAGADPDAWAAHRRRPGRRLGRLHPQRPGPDAIRSVVAYVARVHDGATPEDRMPRARVRAASGRWLTIYASRAREADSDSSPQTPP